MMHLSELTLAAQSPETRARVPNDISAKHVYPPWNASMTTLFPAIWGVQPGSMTQLLFRERHSNVQVTVPSYHCPAAHHGHAYVRNYSSKVFTFAPSFALVPFEILFQWHMVGRLHTLYGVAQDRVGERHRVSAAYFGFLRPWT